MALATPNDVRALIDTNLADEDLTDIIGTAASDIDREYEGTDITFDSNQDRADFEAVLAALRVVTGRDREVMIERRGEVRVDYGASQVASIRARVGRLDPGDAFSRTGGLKRDTDRYTRTVERNE